MLSCICLQDPIVARIEERIAAWTFLPIGEFSEIKMNLTCLSSDDKLMYQMIITQ